MDIRTIQLEIERQISRLDLLARQLSDEGKPLSSEQKHLLRTVISDRLNTDFQVNLSLWINGQDDLFADGMSDLQTLIKQFE